MWSLAFPAGVWALIIALLSALSPAAAQMIVTPREPSKPTNYFPDLNDKFRPRLVLGIVADRYQRAGGEVSLYCRKGALGSIGVSVIIRTDLAEDLARHVDWKMGFATSPSSAFGSAPNADKTVGLKQLGFEEFLDLSADVTKTFDYTFISARPNVLYLSGYMSMADFQKWVRSPILGTAYRDTEGRWWIFTRTATTISDAHLQQFLHACVG